jgi:hypothetical protein
MEINNDANGMLYGDFDEDEVTDLFEQYKTLPIEVQNVLAKYDDDNQTYENCENLKNALEKVGYTCDYDLGAQPFDLKKL